LKFFELDELGEVPVTPLVRRVLADAGFEIGRAKPQAADTEQLVLLPILLAGGSDYSAHRQQRTGRVRTTRRRAVCKSGLLFDMSPQT